MPRSLAATWGYSSITFLHDIAEDWQKSGKEIHAYYIGDFDPSGMNLEDKCRETLTRYAKGVPVRYWWKKDGVRNEALDLAVYNLAALHGLYALGKRLKPTLDTARPRRDPSRTKSTRKGWLSRKGSGWLA